MAVMAILLIGLLALAIYSLSRTQSAPWAQPLKTPKIQSTLRNPLPQFEFSSGKTVLNPESFKGHWSLLSFWSMTCPPCLIELPLLNEFAQVWTGPELRVITVNIDVGSEDREGARIFLEENQILLPTVFDKDHQIKNPFAVNEYPKHYLIDPSGTIVWEALGAYRWTEASVRDELLKLMELQAPEPAEDPEE